MEVWILIGIGAIGYIIVSVQEWICCRRINKIEKSFGRVECVKCTLPTGEVETLELGKIYVFDPPKTVTITGTVGYKQLEVMGATLNEADRLIKEAREKKI